MLKIIGLITIILIVGAAVYYFGFYKRGKEVIDQAGDVAAAAKGKSRRGRKPKTKK